MKQIYRHRKFVKQFKRLPEKIQDKFGHKLTIFILDPCSIELNNHSLTGEWLGHRSIDITGDIRAVYREEGDFCLFKAIGSHSQLYGK